LPDVPSVATATSNGGQTTIVWDIIGNSKAMIYAGVIENETLTRVTNLNTQFWVDILGRTIRDESIVWHDNQYYLSWVSARFAKHNGIVGTRVTPDLKTLDNYSTGGSTTIAGTTVHYEFSLPVSTNIRSFTRGDQVILVWQAGNSELVTYIDRNGNVVKEDTLLRIVRDQVGSADGTLTANNTFAVAYSLPQSQRVELEIIGLAKRRAAR
jgi:hypothetical protein